ncbi:MAG TPA: hypothetical protein DGG95_08600 [Cytophagales bacterium]|jgi:hypothetical protein|nr:hypothetical protein [Cytophagales bacterium]
MNILKCFVLTILFFTSLACLSQAQLQLDAGVKGGFNYSRINSTSAVAFNPGFYSGYHAGIYAMFKIDNFAIQPEIVYSAQGQTYQYRTFDNYNTVLNYLNIPIVFKVYVVEGLNIQAGPQFGFLMSSKDEVITTGVSSSPMVSSQSINDYIKSHDASVILGLGYDFPFGLNVTARYNIGASNINYYSSGNLPYNTSTSTTTSTSMGTSKAFNEVFQFSIGYRLLKKEFESK